MTVIEYPPTKSNRIEVSNGSTALATLLHVLLMIGTSARPCVSTVFKFVASVAMITLVESLSIDSNHTQLLPLINIVDGNLSSTCRRDLSIGSTRHEQASVLGWACVWAFGWACVWAFAWAIGWAFVFALADPAAQEQLSGLGMAPESNPKRLLGIPKRHSRTSR